MKKFIVERTIPGAGKLGAKDLSEIAARSNAVGREIGTDVQWLQTYVTGDKLYCVYNAKNADVIREHARRGGFPIDSVLHVSAVVDPTAEELR